MGTSFEGMEGMQGMSGASGSAAVAQSFYPDRVDLPFVTIWEKAGSPSVDTPIAESRCWIAEFPSSSWTTEWYSWLVLTDFVKNKAWSSFDLLPTWARDSQNPEKAVWNSNKAKAEVNPELAMLIEAAQDERPDALGEILGQNNEFVSTFMNLISAPGSHPRTARLLQIASFIAGFCAMYYKGKYKRPRPSMVCPALLPPVDVPGHASFPSGHSTQAHLIALCLKDVLEHTAWAPMGASIDALADRIARNREIAGLHYKSDTDAGTELAIQVHELLMPTKTADSSTKKKANSSTTKKAKSSTTQMAENWYQKAFDDAKTEWMA